MIENKYGWSSQAKQWGIDEKDWTMSSLALSNINPDYSAKQHVSYSQSCHTGYIRANDNIRYQRPAQCHQLKR